MTTPDKPRFRLPFPRRKPTPPRPMVVVGPRRRVQVELPQEPQEFNYGAVGDIGFDDAENDRQDRVE